MTPGVLTTSGPGELLVAFVAVDGPKHGGQGVTSVTGGGLTWARVTRTTGGPGVTEVWQAYATARFSDRVKVRSESVATTARSSSLRSPARAPPWALPASAMTGPSIRPRR